jgi:hypothetical protein
MVKKSSEVVSFRDLYRARAFPNINACMYVISIMNIPTIPNKVAIPVVLSPKMLPSTIKKTAITQTKTPTLSVRIANFSL